MTVVIPAVGATISHSDYDALQTAVSNILGTGYGQTVQSTAKSVGNTISHNDWDALWNDIATCYLHQTGTSLGQGTALDGFNLVPPVANTPITDAVLTQYYYVVDIDGSNANANSITKNKHVAIGSSQISSLTTLQFNSTPATTSYSSAWNNTLVITSTITFASANSANYFFYSGGTINVVPTNNGTTNKDIYCWQALFTAYPVVINYSIFSGLTNSLSTVFTHAGLGTGYTSNTYLVQASYNSSTYVLTVVLNLEDNVLQDNIDGTTTATIQATIPSFTPVSTSPVTILTPTAATPAFTGGTPVNSSYQYVITSGGNTIYSVTFPGGVLTTYNPGLSVIQGNAITFAISTPVTPFATQSNLYWRVKSISNGIVSGDITGGVTSGNLTGFTIGGTNTSSPPSITITPNTTFTSNVGLSVEWATDSMYNNIVLTTATIVVTAYPTTYTVTEGSVNTNFDANPMFILTATLNTPAVTSITIPVTYTSLIPGISGTTYSLTFTPPATAVVPSAPQTITLPVIGAAATSAISPNNTITFTTPTTYSPGGSAPSISYTGSSLATYTMSAEPIITITTTTAVTNGDGKTATPTTILQSGSQSATFNLTLSASVSSGTAQPTITGITFDSGFNATITGSQTFPYTLPLTGSYPANYSINVASLSNSPSTVSGNVNITYTVPAGNLGSPGTLAAGVYTISIPVKVSRIPSTIALSFNPSSGAFSDGTSTTAIQGTLDVPVPSGASNIVLTINYTGGGSLASSFSPTSTITLIFTSSGGVTATSSNITIPAPGSGQTGTGTIQINYPGTYSTSTYIASDSITQTISPSPTPTQYAMGAAGAPVFSVQQVTDGTDSGFALAGAPVYLYWKTTNMVSGSTYGSMNFTYSPSTPVLTFNQNPISNSGVGDNESPSTSYYFTSATTGYPTSGTTYSITFNATSYAGKTNSPAPTTITIYPPNITFVSAALNSGSGITSGNITAVQSTDTVTITWSKSGSSYMGSSTKVNLYIGSSLISGSPFTSTLSGSNYTFTFTPSSIVSNQTISIYPVNAYNAVGAQATGASPSITVIAAPSYAITATASPTTIYYGSTGNIITVNFTGVVNRQYSLSLIHI